MLEELSCGRPADVEPAVDPGGGHWQNRLHQRPYRFPATGEAEQELSAHINHDGTGYFFPLGTPDAETAASRARQIYEMAASEGWHAACGNFSRELIVSFEWCMNPVLWTYTTIHTLVGNRGVRKTAASPVRSHKQPVVVVEADPGVREALCWGIDQQEGFASVPCISMAACPQLVAFHKPRLVFQNRNLADPSDFESAGTASRGRPGVPAVVYSTHADGKQMFASAPGGAGGYLIKRVKPNRLLEPILKVGSRSDLMSQDLLPRVKCYFQAMLQLDSSEENPALASLTERERATLELLSKGCVDKEIAQALGISPWTVHGHIKKIFERLKVHTRTEAVIRYLEK